MKKLIVTLSLLFFVVGCGGGGGSSSDTSATPGQTTSVSSAKGLWTGTTSNGRSIIGIVLSNGSYYFLYSSQINQNSIVGVTQGSGTSNGNAFYSSNTRDFNFEGIGISSAILSAICSQKNSLNGTVTYSGGTQNTFSCTYNPDYEGVPSLSLLSGTFSGQVEVENSIQNATITVSSSGVLSGNSNGCQLSGTVSPRSDSNTYNVSITFGSSPCFFPGQTFTGICYFDTATNKIYSALFDSARTNCLIFIGVK